jgi:hypothetical protein
LCIFYLPLRDILRGEPLADVRRCKVVHENCEI